MKLAPVNCSRGAPMGRADCHDHGATNILFELEWVPFVDDCYDSGGAYWGLPTNLYCVEGESADIVVRFFVRAPSRDHAKAKALDLYPGSTFQPENGSLIKQTIECLEGWLLGTTKGEDTQATEDDISDLEDMLEYKGLTA